MSYEFFQFFTFPVSLFTFFTTFALSIINFINYEFFEIPPDCFKFSGVNLIIVSNFPFQLAGEKTLSLPQWNSSLCDYFYFFVFILNNIHFFF